MAQRDRRAICTTVYVYILKYENSHLQSCPRHLDVDIWHGREIEIKIRTKDLKVETDEEITGTIYKRE